MDNVSRRLRFINPRKHSVAAYKKRAQLSMAPQVDLLGFSCSAEDYLREKEHNRLSANHFKQRDQEWVEYLKSIGGAENLKPAGVFKPSADLKAMCRRGIPVAFRCLIWQKISMCSLYRLQFPRDYYKTLLGRVSEIKGKVAEDIEKDVDRTFPEHKYFEPAGHGENSLRRILQAFAVHNQDIGYCQSLNFVAGMMLILLPEEDAFWLLVTVVEKLLPPDYYTKSMVGTYVDQFVLAHILKKYLPRIHLALESHQLQLPLITVQWFMCIFVNTLRPEVTLRVWDMFLNEGSKVIFRIAGALFKLHETKLLAVKDASDLFEVLRGIGKEVVDADKLIAMAYKSYSAKPLMRKVSRQQMPGSPGGDAHLTVSPRLSNKSWFGAVPTELMGMGLAHTGPADAYDKMMARLSMDKSMSVTVAVTDETLGLEMAVLDIATRISEPLEKDILDVVAVLSDQLLQEEAKADGEQVEVIDDPVFSQPELLMHRFTESAVGSHMFSAQYEKKLHKKKRAVKGRDGDFDFHRCDLALWRSSFRPALEERYERMEQARQQWRKNSSVVKDNTSPIPMESLEILQAQGEASISPSSAGAPISPAHRISPVRVSVSSSTSPLPATPQRSSSFTEVLRRSSARQSIVLPPAQTEADDAEETAATYRIDQEIAVDHEAGPSNQQAGK